MRQKRLLASGLAVLTVASLTACGNGGSSGGGGSDANAKTISWLDIYTSEPGNTEINNLIHRYESEHQGVTIHRTAVPMENLASTLTKDVATGSSPDVVFIDDPDNQQYANQGLIADLSSYVSSWPTKSEYYKGPWQSTQYQGKTYSVPLYSDAPGLYGNMALLKQDGITSLPTTWSALRKDAKAATSGKVQGLCFGTTPYESASYLFLPFLWQTGGDLNNIATSAVPGLTLFKQLMADGSAPRDVLTWTWEDAMTQFSNGKCAMVIGGPWDTTAASKASSSVQVALPPTKDGGTPASVLGGFNIASGAKSNTAAGWKVIDWFTQKKNLAEYLTKTTQLPNRKDLADLPFITKSSLLPTFVKSISIGKPRAYGKNYPKMSQQIQTMLQNVLYGKKSPQQAASAAESTIKPLLQR